MNNNNIAPKGLNVFEVKVVELLSQGKKKKEVADELGMSLTEVYNISNRKAVKVAVEQSVSEITTSIIKRNVPLMSAVIEDKLLQMEEEGGRLADLTKKDVVDLIGELSKMNAAAINSETKQSMMNQENGYAQLLQQILVVNNNTTVINNKNESSWEVIDIKEEDD